MLYHGQNNQQNSDTKNGSFLNPLYGMLLEAKAAAHSAMLHFKHFPHDRVLINLHFNKNGLTTDIIRRSCITLFNSCLCQCVLTLPTSTPVTSRLLLYLSQSTTTVINLYTVDKVLEPKRPVTPSPLFLIYIMLDSTNTAKRLC